MEMDLIRKDSAEEARRGILLVRMGYWFRVFEWCLSDASRGDVVLDEMWDIHAGSERLI